MRKEVFARAEFFADDVHRFGKALLGYLVRRRAFFECFDDELFGELFFTADDGIFQSIERWERADNFCLCRCSHIAV